MEEKIEWSRFSGSPEDMAVIESLFDEVMNESVSYIGWDYEDAKIVLGGTNNSFKRWSGNGSIQKVSKEIEKWLTESNVNCAFVYVKGDFSLMKLNEMITDIDAGVSEKVYFIAGPYKEIDESDKFEVIIWAAQNELPDYAK